MSEYYDVCNRCHKEFHIKDLEYQPKASTLVFGGRPFYEKRCKNCEKEVSRSIENIMKSLLSSK